VQLPHLLSGTTDPFQWLDHLKAALPVLELPRSIISNQGSSKLLQAVLQGITSLHHATPPGPHAQQTQKRAEVSLAAEQNKQLGESALLEIT
jgi:hypothetical protein